MRRSESLMTQRREAPPEDHTAARRVLQAGLARRLGSGRFALTPVGERVRQSLIEHLHTVLSEIGGQVVTLPQLQGKDTWTQSGRWDSFEGEMFTLEDRNGRELCLAPSHEEAMVEVLRGYVRSHADLPQFLFQTGRKHRDDHPRHGLLRTKEFTMTDGYSFHLDSDSLADRYTTVRSAFDRYFQDIGLDVVTVTAENSVMGGSTSEEFIAPVEAGSVSLLRCPANGCGFAMTDESQDWEPTVESLTCPECGETLLRSAGIEVGHVFQLGTRYSEPMNLTVDGPSGEQVTVYMGSYGIGIERTLQTLVAQHGDEDGCRFPVTDAGTVAPYRAAILPVEYEGTIKEMADRLHQTLGTADILLFDDDRESLGERFAVSDRLGIPVKLVLGTRFAETGGIEIEARSGDTSLVEPDTVPDNVPDRIGHEPTVGYPM